MINNLVRSSDISTFVFSVFGEHFTTLLFFILFLVGAGLSASAESVKRPSIHRSSSRGDKSRHLPNRSSSRRKNKENGTKQIQPVVIQSSGIITQSQHNGSDEKKSSQLDEGRGGKKSVVVSGEDDGKGVVVGVTPQDCTEMDVQTICVTLTYKPRI
jgi:hypothetical protein